MKTMNDILARMEAAAADIPAAIQAQKALGKKVVGVFPVYAPEELVHAAGMFPVGCWGGQVPISKAAKLLPPFACPVMQGITELSLSGTYDCLDGALLSTPCDTLKCLTQNFMSTCPNVKAIFCIYPQNNKLPGGVRYLYNQLKQVGRALEELSGAPLTEAAIQHSIGVYNENRAAMAELTALLAQKPGVLTPLQRGAVMKARWCMDKEEHTALVRDLTAALRAAPDPAPCRRKVVLAGIMTEPRAFLQVLGELGYAVVADELAYESRQFRTPVPPGIDPYDRLARQWESVAGCSLVFDPEGRRIEGIVELAQKSRADGVLYCQMKFCEEEEFDYPHIRRALAQADIPVLNIEIDPLGVSQEQARTRLQAFGEQLELTI